MQILQIIELSIDGTQKNKKITMKFIFIVILSFKDK
jgi:hypothetical protein